MDSSELVNHLQVRVIHTILSALGHSLQFGSVPKRPIFKFKKILNLLLLFLTKDFFQGILHHKHDL
jgi:hypothetical protein